MISYVEVKDQYPQGNNLNEQQEEWKESNNSSKINRNSTKKYQLIASRSKFQPIYTEPLELKEDDAHTIDLHINNLATQNARRPFPVPKKYLNRDILLQRLFYLATQIIITP